MSFFEKSTPDTNEQKSASSDDVLHSSLRDNMQQIKKTVGNSNDIIIREIKIGKLKNQLI